MSCNQPGQIVVFTKCLLFTVGMVVRSAQSRLRTDHGEDHPLLHRDTFRRESSLLQTGNHGETVLTFPRENGAGEDKTEDDNMEEDVDDDSSVSDSLSPPSSMSTDSPPSTASSWCEGSDEEDNNLLVEAQEPGKDWIRKIKSCR